MAKVFLWMFSVGLVVSSISTWLAPRFLSWYASPPVPLGVSCDMAIEWAMQQLIIFQIAGGISGAILGLIIYLWLRGNQKIQQHPPAMPPSQPANMA